jgi:DNA-binding NarL/FixJ family response regulator
VDKVETKKKVVIVDDHPLLRQGIIHLIMEEPDLEVCAGAEDADEALIVIEQHKPDLAIVDISLKGISGLELTERLKERFPDIPVLILSMHKETIYAERALKVGARGYVMKQTVAGDVLKAIREVLAGRIFLSDAMKEVIIEKVGAPHPANAESLTSREIEVLALIGQGIKSRLIAKMLRLSPKTVDSHCANIKAKLNLNDSAELAEYAVLWHNETKY